MPTVYYPFKNEDTNGPGPLGQTNIKAGKWACKCEKVHRDLSICKCVGIRTLKSGKVTKAKKTVRIDLKKKREYQKKFYRPFLKRQARRRR